MALRIDCSVGSIQPSVPPGEVARARIFTSILTPNYDKPHSNHFHFDLAVDVKWRIVR